MHVADTDSSCKLLYFAEIIGFELGLSQKLYLYFLKSVSFIG